jgi:hypothetical protein
VMQPITSRTNSVLFRVCCPVTINELAPATALTAPGPRHGKVDLPMQDESKQVPEQASPLVEELILLQVLRDDRPDGCSINELHAEIGYDREDITDSVDSLAAVGVVVLDGEQVRPSRAAMRIDALGMICI